MHCFYTLFQYIVVFLHHAYEIGYEIADDRQIEHKTMSLSNEKGVVSSCFHPPQQTEFYVKIIRCEEFLQFNSQNSILSEVTMYNLYI